MEESESMIAKAFSILLLFLLVQAEPSARAGEIFRWLDEDGIPHFTDNVSKIPPAYRDRAEVQTLPDLPVTEPIAPSDSFEPSAETDLEGHDQQWWREQVQTWQSRKKASQLKLADAEKKLGRLQFENDAPSYRIAEKNQLLEEIEKYRREVQQAQEMLETSLPDAARKAGVPPGWLR